MGLIPSKSYLRRYLESDSQSTKSYHFDIFIISLIFLSVIIYVTKTYDIPKAYVSILNVVDIVIMVIFSIEILFRFWVERYKKNYFKSPYNIIDLFVVIPFWIGIGNLNFFRIIRFFRILRYLEKYLTMSHIIDRDRFERLFITKIIFSLFSILYISSALVFTIEGKYNPDISTFGDALYFSVVSIATVGYGDIVPVTDFGRWISMGVILSGILLLPWFFSSLMRTLVVHSRKNKIICPSCGLSYHDPDSVFCRACGSKLYKEENYEF